MTSFAIFIAVLGCLAAPLLAVAGLLRAYPRWPLVALAVVPAAASFLVFWGPSGLAALAVVDGAALAVFLADLCTLPRRKSLSVERQVGRIASLRKSHAVALTVLNHGRRAVQLEVRDGAGAELSPRPDQFRLRLAGRSRAVLHYELHPNRRGAFTLAEVFVRASSWLRLWQRSLAYPHPSLVHVYPDMKQLAQYALLARTNRLSLLGVRRTRRIGQDNEFERLRDFTLDDNYKHIDWRATARRMKLTVRDHQSSQSQRVVFLMDCGRMMTNLAEGLSLLDHGLNAMLMLSYVALRQGDSVGLLTFSDEIHDFVPPRSGMRQMNRLLHAAFDRFPQLSESRYDQAFRYLAAHCRKRSLVVLVTSVIDEVNSRQIEQYLANVVGRHLPLAVLLRDRTLFEAAEIEQPDAQQLWRAAAAADILAWRHQVLGDLQRKGVLALDVFPEQMTAPLVNRYLEVKARHLL